MERRNHLLATAASLSARSDPLLRQAAAVYGERAREETAALVAARSAEADAEIARQLARQQRKSPMENGGGTTTIDLHGFTLDDGVRIALRETAAWWDALADTAKSKRAASSFTIITGAGRHSADGRARMLSGCARALLQAGWRCEVGTGSVVVTGRAR